MIKITTLEGLVETLKFCVKSQTIEGLFLISTKDLLRKLDNKNVIKNVYNTASKREIEQFESLILTLSIYENLKSNPSLNEFCNDWASFAA